MAMLAFSFLSKENATAFLLPNFKAKLVLIYDETLSTKNHSFFIFL